MGRTFREVQLQEPIRCDSEALEILCVLLILQIGVLSLLEVIADCWLHKPACAHSRCCQLSVVPCKGVVLNTV